MTCLSNNSHFLSSVRSLNDGMTKDRCCLAIKRASNCNLHCSFTSVGIPSGRISWTEILSVGHLDGVFGFRGQHTGSGIDCYCSSSTGDSTSSETVCVPTSSSPLDEESTEDTYQSNSRKMWFNISHRTKFRC
jgi:hypothetical protein